ncbi:MAG: PAS domain S-box protein [Lentisphaerae bacterium]|nr:PAS domain S-box protein [Lentisphaerota bacterium]
MKPAFLDKLIERLDKLDPTSLQMQFLRLTREKGVLEAMFNTIQDGILVLDAGGHVLYANAAAAGLLGFKPESLPRQPIGRYLRDVEWDRILNLDSSEWSRLITREVEITYPRRRFLSLVVTPMADATARERELVLILRDITDQRRKEHTLIQSERLNAVTLLAAGVAHEIGNPLNSLNIHLQLAEREIGELPEDARKSLGKLLGVARSEVERLTQIITQFLKAVRPTLPELSLASLRELVMETLDFMKPEIENRDVLVEVRDQGDIPPVSADRNQMRQAFFNIVKNALQSMSKGGILTITLFSTDAAAGVSFKDTGAGIPSDMFAHLFEPYHTTKASGSGLGLMIVQRIVRDHGGEIEIESKPGAGTTFTVILPLDARRVRLLKAPRKPRSGRKLRPPKEVES